MTGYLIVAFIDLLVATYVLFVSRSKVALAFSFLWACFAVWSFNLYLATTITDLQLLTPWFHRMRFGMLCIAPAMLMFFSVVTRTRFTLLLQLIIGLSLTTSILLYLINNTFLPSELEPEGFGYSSAPDIISKIHEINFVSACLLSIAITLKAYKSAIFREKQRIKWLIIATVLGSVLGVLSFNNSKLFGMAGNVIGLSLMAYAVLRYHVVGIAEAINGGIVKASAALVVLLGFLFLHSGLRQIHLNSSEQLIATLGLIFVLLEAYRRLVNLFQAAHRKMFHTDYYDYNFTLGYLLKALKNCNSLTGFILLANELFLKIIRVQKYSLHIFPDTESKDTKLRLVEPSIDRLSSLDNLPASPLLDSALLNHMQELKRPLFYDDAPETVKSDFLTLNASVCIPLLNGEEIEGFIVLGPPTKKEEFARNDTKLVAWFSREAGHVLETVVATSRLENSLNEAEKTLSVMARLNAYNHDVKTPFANIEALLLAEDAFTPQERHEKILEQVVRGRSLVSTMTKILRGRQNAHNSNFDLNELILKVVDTFPTRSSLVTTSLHSLPAFYGNEDDLSIMFLNLLNNAFEAQSQPEFKIQIETRFDEKSRKIVCFFRDTGCGIPQDQLAQIWDQPRSTKLSSGGTGLGLSVVKRIVEDHGGNICVESQVGQGTQFLITFPEKSEIVTAIGG